MNVIDKWKMILQSENIDDRYLDIFSQYCEKHSKLAVLESIHSNINENTLPVSIRILKTLYKIVKNVEIVLEETKQTDVYLVSAAYNYEYLPSEEEIIYNLSLKAVDVIRKKLIETNSNRIYISHMLASNLKTNKDNMSFDMFLRFSTK